LAKEEVNALLVIDDLDARNYAIDMGLNVTGTLGVLNKAREKDTITLDEAIDIIITMKKNKFRISEKVLNEFIQSMKEDDKKR